jgi:hypothetical protein
MAQQVEHVPSKHEALSSNPVLWKKKKKKKEEDRRLGDQQGFSLPFRRSSKAFKVKILVNPLPHRPFTLEMGLNPGP